MPSISPQALAIGLPEAGINVKVIHTPDVSCFPGQRLWKNQLGGMQADETLGMAVDTSTRGLKKQHTDYLWEVLLSCSWISGDGNLTEESCGSTNIRIDYEGFCKVAPQFALLLVLLWAPAFSKSFSLL